MTSVSVQAKNILYTSSASYIEQWTLKLALRMLSVHELQDNRAKAAELSYASHHALAQFHM